MKYWLLMAIATGLNSCANGPPRHAASLDAGVVSKTASVPAANSLFSSAGLVAVPASDAGLYMSRMRNDLSKQLAQEIARRELRITQIKDGSIKMSIDGDANFDPGNAQMKLQTLELLAKIAETLNIYDQTVIHVVGHMDGMENVDLSQSLSERRAASVASYLSERSVPQNRLRQEGRGSREPLTHHQGKAGQRQNHRVDIVVKAIVQGREQHAWTPPSYLGASH